MSEIQQPTEATISDNGREPLSKTSGSNERQGSLSLAEIDSLLSQLPHEENSSALASRKEQGDFSVDTHTERIIEDTDNLLSELDRAIESTARNMRQWSVDKKRQEAANTQDQFALELLVGDENPIVRTLALCNPNTPSELLESAGRSYNAWSQLIAANNPSTPPDVLADLASSELDDIKQGVKRNPNSTEVTKYKLTGRNENGDEYTQDDHVSP